MTCEKYRVLLPGVHLGAGKLPGGRQVQVPVLPPPRCHFHSTLTGVLRSSLRLALSPGVAPSPAPQAASLRLPVPLGRWAALEEEGMV